jgi:phage tail protein X
MNAPRRAAVVVAVAALLVAVGAARADAHAVGGAQASNYQTRILKVEPVVPGLQVEVADAGARLRVRNRTGREVTVLGYAGEPYLRVGPAGVFENRRSPATYLNRARINPAPPPPDANADAPPLWHRIGDGDTVTWHDHRAHWMGNTDPPQVKAAPNRTQVVLPGWQVELQVGSQHVRVSGDLRWVPGPSPWPWLATAVAWLLVVLLAARHRRWPQLLAVLTGLLIAVDVVHTVGIWNGTSAPVSSKAAASIGSWAGWVLGGLAIHRLLGPHPHRASLYLVIAGILMANVGGIGDLGSLYRSQLAVALPDPVTRALVAATLGLGVGLLVSGLRLAGPRPRRRPRPASGGPLAEGAGADA